MINGDVDDRYTFSKHRRERLVTLGWSEIIDSYNAPDRMLDTGPRKYVMK